MEFNNLNLCNEIIAEMERLEFDKSSIDVVKSNPQFVDAYNKNDVLQKTMLIMLFYGIIVNGSISTPTNVRLSLNIAPDVKGWIDDMKIVILPWLKGNQQSFFKA